MKIFKERELHVLYSVGFFIVFMFVVAVCSGCSIGIYRDWRGLPENKRAKPEPIVRIWEAQCRQQAINAARYGVTPELRPEFIRLCVIEYAQADFKKARNAP